MPVRAAAIALSAARPMASGVDVASSAASDTDALLSDRFLVTLPGAVM
jgi:hypothetical protein